ncbi:MAG: hypothetical protein JWR15_1348 [Prosthecobacter sp.]|nr:hypothetical protein [Prosthecobacter sp.]
MHIKLLFICVVLLSGCGERRKSVEHEAPREPAPFKDSSFTDITPLIDGSVYAQDFDGRLWYIKGTAAAQVKTTGEALPNFSEIIPGADGSAYATTWKPGLWHLVGTSATKVTESSGTSSSIRQVPTTNAFFALYAHERHRRLAAENRASEAEDMASRASDSDSADDYDIDN